MFEFSAQCVDDEFSALGGDLDAGGLAAQGSKTDIEFSDCVGETTRHAPDELVVGVVCERERGVHEYTAFT